MKANEPLSFRGCGVLEDDLFLYLEGELPDGRAVERVRLHLESCASCGAFVAEHDALTSAILSGGVGEDGDAGEDGAMGPVEDAAYLPPDPRREASARRVEGILSRIWAEAAPRELTSRGAAASPSLKRAFPRWRLADFPRWRVVGVLRLRSGQRRRILGAAAALLLAGVLVPLVVALLSPPPGSRQGSAVASADDGDRANRRRIDGARLRWILEHEGQALLSPGEGLEPRRKDGRFLRLYGVSDRIRKAASDREVDEVLTVPVELVIDARPSSGIVASERERFFLVPIEADSLAGPSAEGAPIEVEPVSWFLPAAQAEIRRDVGPTRPHVYRVWVMRSPTLLRVGPDLRESDGGKLLAPPVGARGTSRWMARWILPVGWEPEGR